MTLHSPFVSAYSMIEVFISELESQGPVAHQPDIKTSEIAQRANLLGKKADFAV